MIDKAKTVLTIILIAILVIGIGYSLVKLITSSFQEPDLITSIEIPLYKIDNNLVIDYYTYYYLENCFNNLIEACNQSKYEEIYKLYIQDYKEEYSKQEVLEMLKQFTNNKDSIKLKKVYRVENVYLLEIDANKKTEHLLMSIEDGKKSNYQFAFIK